MITVGSQVIGGTSGGGGGGGSTIPDPDGDNVVLGTNDGATWVPKAFGDAFLAFAVPNLGDLQGLLGVAPTSTDTASTSDSTPTNVHDLSLAPGTVTRFRILVVAQTEDLSTWLALERQSTVRCDVSGDYTTTHSDVGYHADGGWVAPSPVMPSPHVDILDSGGGAGHVRVTGLDATDLAWRVRVEQL